MLVYLASYPRSGNSLLQKIVAVNFGWLPSQVKSGPVKRLIEGVPDGWEAWPTGEPVEGWPEPVIWNDSTTAYRRTGGPWRRRLQPVRAEFFTEDTRRALAAEANIFFVKTHHPPFDRYLPGERVIQSVRNPGAAILSYFRLLRSEDAARANAPGRFSFDSVIAGGAPFGSWTGYQGHWDQAASQLGPAYLELTYADMAQDQAAARGLISDFLGLEAVSEAPIDFERYRAKRPGLELRGRDEGYEQFYAQAQLEALWRLHGALAERHGFAPPQWSLAGQLQA